MSSDTSRGATRDGIGEPRFHELVHMEYDYLTTQFLKNEEMGEKRVGLLVTLTAGIGAAALLARDQGSADLSISVTGLFIVILAVWLSIAYLTLLRIIRRNAITDRLKSQLRQLRKWYVSEESPNRRYLPYDPYKESDQRRGGLKLVSGHGGYADLTALIVSLTAGALVWLLAHAVFASERTDTGMVPRTEEQLGVAIAMLSVVLVWWLLVAIAEDRYGREMDKLEGRCEE